MKKTFLSLLLACLPLLVSASVKIGSLYYNLEASGKTAEVAVYPDERYAGDITIPAEVTYGGTTYRVTAVASRAFWSCTELTSLVLPESVTSIGSYAFQYCEKLSRVNIPSGLTRIENGTFYGCKRLPSAIIPQGITVIGEEAFWDCGGVQTLVIPEGVTQIGASAFLACTQLTSLKIPASVVSIGENAFAGEGALTSIVVDEDNRFYDSRDRCNALIETATNTLLTGCMNTIIPEGITSLADNSFDGCVQLKRITIPRSVKRIGRAAFDNCVSLESIIIPDGVEQLGAFAFFYCQKLKKLHIPEGVKVIEESICLYCESLESVTIPTTATTVEDSPFPGNVKDIYCFAAVPPRSTWGSTITIQPYEEIDGRYVFPATLHVPVASVDAYKTCSDGWQEFQSIIPLTTEETGIQERTERRLAQSAEWYTIDGRAITGRPTSAGIFIRKGADGTVKKYFHER